jgi:GNAT superfamily N-acetyltransferase
MSTTIKELTLDDEDYINQAFTMLWHYAQETTLNYGHAPDKDKALHSILHFVASDHFCVFALIENEQVVGVLIGKIQTTWFSYAIVAEDLMVVVRQDRRGALGAKKLVTAFAGWAKAHDARAVFLSSISGINPGRTAQFYQRLGFDVIGMVNVMELE